MACGRPVIASSTPGLAGYVRDGVDGRTAAAGDPAALGEAIEELWEDDEQARALGAAARHTIESGRTIEHFVERVAGAVEGMVAQRE
jgi:glycosyltransferase involved in cell wall biosynthesis